MLTRRWINAALGLLLAGACGLVLSADAVANAPSPSEPEASERMTDEEFLHEWQRRCFLFLWEQADPKTGMVADRAPADGSRRAKVASIASVGFALTAIPIAQERGWVEPDEAYERVVTTLRFIYYDMPHVEGFYYHFVDMATGERVWECELSSIDTALMIAGVLTAGQYYAGTEVERLATKIYHRVNWPWMMNGGPMLSLGWKPESGFIPYYWDIYSEHMLLQLLGLGSPTHPLPPESWHAWRRAPVVQYEGMTFLSYPPLFIHQFSHAWVDFRNKRDDYADYWHNSVLATRAQQRMAIELSDRFPHYGENLWGITSSDSEYGYTAWGGPSPSPHINGTIVPCAAAGSIPFLPDEAIAVVRNIYDTWGKQLWRRYGLVDAFNPHTGWAAPDVIGIDVGITLLMIENHRTGMVWRYFMRNPEIQKAMQVAGFRPLRSGPQLADSTSVFTTEVDEHDRERLRVIEVPRRDAEPRLVQWHDLDLSSLRLASPINDEASETPSARFSLSWDDQTLHLSIEVEDAHFSPDAADRAEHTDSGQPTDLAGLVELMLDPMEDGANNKGTGDFQFGLGVPNRVWEWFGQRRGVDARVTHTAKGYRVDAEIPFEALDVKPGIGATMGASLSIRRGDAAPAAETNSKPRWAMKPRVERLYLGELRLIDKPESGSAMLPPGMSGP
jgi:hypothetical protein